MGAHDPKPAELRRRRNLRVGPIKLPAEGSKRRAPALPLRGLLASTRSWWKTIWASPMAAMYVAADVPALIRLASLEDRASRGDASATVLAEIRQLEDRFGLSPLGRKRLEWEILKAAGTTSARPEASPEDDERWQRLRVVS